MLKIVTPVSHLFKELNTANDIIAYSDYLEGRDHSPKVYTDKEILFHSDLQPIHKLEEYDFENLVEIKKQRPLLQMVSFHLASCYKSPKILNGIFVPNGEKLNKFQLIENAIYNINRIKNIFGNNVLIAVENNNYLQTEAYDIVTDAEFINEVVTKTDIKFLFDISHAHISAYNYGMDFENYVEKLPLTKAIQIHFCKCSYTDEIAIDSHLCPDYDDFMELDYFVNKLPDLKYITVEFYRNPQDLVKVLKILKKYKNATE